MTRSILSLRRAALALALAASAACASATAPDTAVAPPAIPEAQSNGGALDYEATVMAIAERFERDLSFPHVDVALLLYPSRRKFEEGLLDAGYSRSLAREAARSFHAIGGSRAVMVNESLLAQFPREQRVRLLAHELAHTVQYRLCGGVRGTSEQWLREGFADYVACRVTARLGFGSFERLRDAVIAPLEEVDVDARPAPLDNLRTFGDWIRAQSRYKIPLYVQAYLAAELLIEDKGLEAIRAYFEASRPGTDADANFVNAFGLRLDRFESSFERRWRRVLSDRGQGATR